ncbi:SBBP repeat-containing protein [Candidatus Zixiibacteriota bacterium]
MKTHLIITIILILIASGSPSAGEGDLSWCTFLGSEVGEDGLDVDVGEDGTIYVIGYTTSSGFPTTAGAFDNDYSNGHSDAFVAKLSPPGLEMIYCTYLGDGIYLNDAQEAWGIAVDDQGNAHVTGWTNTGDFPTTPEAFDTSYNGDSDAFVVKLNRWGTGLQYATFLGGSADDQAWAIALDDSGNALLCGSTRSESFPATPGAFDETYNGGTADAFVAKLSQDGSRLKYASYFGGSNWDHGQDLAVDRDGNIFMTGRTGSGNVYTSAAAHDQTLGGIADGFVVKFNPHGSEVEYATYLGGGNWDQGDGIAVDDMGYAYVTGSTKSVDFPSTVGAFDENHDGLYDDVFVVKLNLSGTGLSYATFLGGNSGDYGHDIAVDANGRTHVVGETRAADFPTTTGAFDETHNGGFDDVFVTVLNAAGDALDYSTFLGGSGSGDRGNAVALDGTGNTFVVGKTYSEDFPVTSNSFDDSYNGTWDVFVGKLSLGGTGVQSANTDPANPTAYRLQQNYPNPFNASTRIQYSVLRDGHVVIKIYDLLGAEVATLVDDHQRAGSHSVTWEARNVASGVYFCTLNCDEFKTQRKMVVIR